jgi:hypothetical protein
MNIAGHHHSSSAVAAAAYGMHPAAHQFASNAYCNAGSAGDFSNVSHHPYGDPGAAVMRPVAGNAAGWYGSSAAQDPRNFMNSKFFLQFFRADVFLGADRRVTCTAAYKNNNHRTSRAYQHTTKQQQDHQF